MFDIEAKVPDGANQDQVRIMERNLLAERFKLTTHVIKANVAAYEMFLAKSGSKFQRPRLDEKTRGGFFYGLGEVAFTGEPLSMEQLASFLSDYLDLPVVNLTGLAGTWDIWLRFAAETMVKNTSAPPTPVPSLVDALRDQLGLVLERTKTEVDVFVVDHAEKKPTAAPKE